ncbi:MULTISPECIES: sugar kinase [unclassified Spirosoma]|uniref:sugar kinase n=1 Tax=unclassified Spirosoma TaxID=2621999 RepID=UPI000959194B|nr:MULTISPECIES: sugar kinase [unclassified Spirosoma]MBN8820941.1 sugar kinase [Spirosoma sp.]OJW75952.1 MAG: carbohydrate kinase [Spirosoma sp. 48-14]
MVCCFGELLLRFSPVANGEWIRQTVMPVYVGGAELNVATALAKWNVPVKYSTVLPENSLADDIIGYVSSKGIDPSGIVRFGQRVGSYFLPQGSDLKNAGVIYDRAHSAFSELAPGKVDWDAVLQQTSWLHVSAISPALNADVAAACTELVAAASAKGITVSIDLNYRARLWQYGISPVDIMPGIVEHCNVVMGNIWAADALLGIPVDADIHVKDQQADYLNHALETSKAIQERFPRCTVVANTFRFDKVPTGLRYYTTLYTDGQQYVSPELLTDSVVDRVGSGDCFMAGLIYGLYNQHDPQQIVNFAAEAAFGKLQELGDATNQTVDEITKRQQMITSLL